MEKIWQKRIFQSDLILQSIAEGILVIDRRAKIVFANLAAAKQLGYQPAELVGKNYQQILFARDTDETLFCPIAFALDEGETSHVNTETFQRRGKGDFLVEYICVPLVENESVIGVIVTFEDITERREIETAITEARDAALENARARAAFLANMSHEIRTPLNGIIGTTEIFSGLNLDGEQRKYAEMLETSARHLLEIVNEILDFSKNEAGKLTLEKIAFDVAQVVRETVLMFSPLTEKKNLALDLETDASVPPVVFGDPVQLKQVIGNLLSNAVKFTQIGGISVKLRLEEETADSLMLFFEISDSGIGIETDAQQQIFEPFAQADLSTTRRFGGTGLGLAICRQIVEQMNGRIGLESLPGKGARFWFTAKFAKNADEIPNLEAEIPDSRFQIGKKWTVVSGQWREAGRSASNLPNERRTTNHEPRPKTEDRRPKIQNPKSKVQNLKVLLVDDNPVNREIARVLLRRSGIAQTEIADNGLDAVNYCREKDFDLVLMDCRMPQMDGFEATRLILGANENRKKPKIVALTASATDEERRQCFDAGMDDFLSKPITQNALEKILEQVCRDANDLKNLDLDGKLVQHSLSEVLAPEILNNFIDIEAGGEKNFVREMLELFCRYAAAGLTELEQAFSEKDIASIKQKAHSLKGSSANIGAVDLTLLFENLETQADQQNWTKIGEILSQSAEKFRHTKSIIERNYENG